MVARIDKMARKAVEAGSGAGSKTVNRRRPEPLRLVQSAIRTNPKAEPLFWSLSREMQNFLEVLPSYLDEIMPLTGVHKRLLPEAVHELSVSLTSERNRLSRPYFSAPRLTAAYLRYFLPWNLVRFGRFLPKLPLDTPAPDSLIVDLGSGPLTFPLALWLSKPEWHSIPLKILCIDNSIQALEFGSKLFKRLAPDSPWKISLKRGQIHKSLGEIRGQVHLMAAANVLNELSNHGSNEDEPLVERLGELAFNLHKVMEPQGSILCIEPGNRLGGTLLSTLRYNFLELGYQPLSPCTHSQACPFLTVEDTQRSYRGWCHGAMDIKQAPRWLTDLAQEACLQKQSLSLSHMLLRPGEANEDESYPARILSDAFAVPGYGMARYACTKIGLALVPGAGDLPQGVKIVLKPMIPPKTDAKTGAKIMVVK